MSTATTSRGWRIYNLRRVVVAWASRPCCPSRTALANGNCNDAMNSEIKTVNNGRRHIWQIHLSTAIIMMFLAAGLTGLLLPTWQTAYVQLRDASSPLEQIANPAKAPNSLILFKDSVLAERFWEFFATEHMLALFCFVAIGVLTEKYFRFHRSAIDSRGGFFASVRLGAGAAPLMLLGCCIALIINLRNRSDVLSDDYGWPLTSTFRLNYLQYGSVAEPGIYFIPMNFALNLMSGLALITISVSLYETIRRRVRTKP